MINIGNYFIGNLIRIIALIVLLCKPRFKIEFKVIVDKIAYSNRLKINLTDHLNHAVIQIEDKRYYNHLGVDFYAILRAIINNITTKKFEGASTIAQQLVRNITDEREIKMRRKIKEIIFASLIDYTFSKNEILSAYLNTYKFNNCIGILSFCKREKYDLKNISLNEAAQIAARLKFPSLNKVNYIKYLKRVRTIEKKLYSTPLAFNPLSVNLNTSVVSLRHNS